MRISHSFSLLSAHLIMCCRPVADAIYARVPGAKFENVSGFGETYTIPCNVELNVTFKFHNVSYPIHPLDTSLDIGRTDALGNAVCLGAYQPILPGAEASTFDAILGMAFCAYSWATSFSFPY